MPCRHMPLLVHFWLWVGAEDCTPELAEVSIRWKNTRIFQVTVHWKSDHPLEHATGKVNIHWKMPQKSIWKRLWNTQRFLRCRFLVCNMLPLVGGMLWSLAGMQGCCRGDRQTGPPGMKSGTPTFYPPSPKASSPQLRRYNTKPTCCEGPRLTRHGNRIVCPSACLEVRIISLTARCSGSPPWNPLTVAISACPRTINKQVNSQPSHINELSLWLHEISSWLKYMSLYLN